MLHTDVSTAQNAKIRLDWKTGVAATVSSRLDQLAGVAEVKL